MRPIISNLCPSIPPKNVTCVRSGNLRLASPPTLSSAGWAYALPAVAIKSARTARDRVRIWHPRDAIAVLMRIRNPPKNKELCGIKIRCFQTNSADKRLSPHDSAAENMRCVFAGIPIALPLQDLQRSDELGRVGFGLCQSAPGDRTPPA